MPEFEIDNQKFVVIPLTIMGSARVEALAQAITDRLKESTDSEIKILATQYGGYIWLYAKFVVNFIESPYNLLPKEAPVEKHIPRFLSWVDQESYKIKAVNEAYEDVTAPPGDKRLRPPETLTDDEKKVMLTTANNGVRSLQTG